ncbi:hypothetical protein EWI07_11850 [Sporolactobacillus sp. THM7-4]|nr:hypothetical protein EWI07_11850 [Sporolactobacillus sp. THM7-4]
MPETHELHLHEAEQFLKQAYQAIKSLQDSGGRDKAVRVMQNLQKAEQAIDDRLKSVGENERNQLINAQQKIQQAKQILLHVESSN